MIWCISCDFGIKCDQKSLLNFSFHYIKRKWCSYDDFPNHYIGIIASKLKNYGFEPTCDFCIISWPFACDSPTIFQWVIPNSFTSGPETSDHTKNVSWPICGWKMIHLWLEYHKWPNEDTFEIKGTWTWSIHHLWPHIKFLHL